MNVDGVWKVEMLGAYGWEPNSTAFLQDGKYMAGSKEHYSVGTYSIEDEKLLVRATVITYMGERTLFGQQGTRHEVRFEGSLSAGTVTGVARDERDEFLVRFRATKLADLS